MKIAILGDIHSNLTAFEAVLSDIKSKGGFDRIWCLGDVVGYGPEPHECIALLRQHDHVCVAGNHDWAAISKMDTSDFNPAAALAAQWTSQQLTEKDKRYLRGLKTTIVHDDFTLVHGSPREPIWEYLFPLAIDIAKDNFSHFDTAFCLVGHSHLPLVFESIDGSVVYRVFEDGVSLELGTNRLLINTGSVGQPRDGDPRASYALYDDEARVIHHYRVEYDILATQKKMQEQELPTSLIKRLSYGL